MGCILFYAGNLEDIILNYVLLMINFIYCYYSVSMTIRMIVVSQQQKEVKEDTTTNTTTNTTNYCSDTTTNSKTQRIHYYYYFALAALIFVLLFQICLCLVVGCVGISIIWCAMGGWIMSDRRRQQKHREGVISLFVRTNTTAGTNSQQQYRFGITTTNNNENEEERDEKIIYSLGRGVTLLNCAVIVYYSFVGHAITTIAHVCALILGAVLSQLSLRLFFAIAIDPSSITTTPTTSHNHDTTSDGNNDEVVNVQSSTEYDIMEDDGYADGDGNERTRSRLRQQPLLGIS